MTIQVVDASIFNIVKRASVRYPVQLIEKLDDRSRMWHDFETNMKNVEWGV